jgi:sn-glycerol 3-phosphate transport system permease protein
VSGSTSTTSPTRRRTSRGRRRASAWTYVILGVLFVLVLFPAYYAVAGSFMGTADTNSFPPALWPTSGIHAENYSGVLRLIPLERQYLNSILQTGAITIGQVVTSALAAYAFVFLDLRWRGLWFALFLSTMMIPYE